MDAATILDWLAALVRPLLTLGPLTRAALLFTLCFMVVGGLFLRRLGTLSRPALANSAASLMFLLTTTLLNPALAPLYRGLRDAWSSAGLPQLSPGVWQALPAPLAIGLALFAADGVRYAAHRALHTNLGWPVHAIHHSDSHVNGFTSWRIHPLEGLTTAVMALLFTGWMGVPPGYQLVVIAILLAHNIYIHLEVDIDHGPLRHVIASPRYHRWHHRDAPEAYNTNLANMFPVYDLVFGTWCEPRVIAAPIGAKSDGVPDVDFVRLWLLPFTRWAAMLGRWWGGRRRAA